MYRRIKDIFVISFCIIKPPYDLLKKKHHVANKSELIPNPLRDTYKQIITWCRTKLSLYYKWEKGKKNLSCINNTAGHFCEFHYTLAKQYQQKLLNIPPWAHISCKKARISLVVLAKHDITGQLRISRQLEVGTKIVISMGDKSFSSCYLSRTV